MGTQIPKPAHGSLAWLRLRHHDEHGLTRFGASEAPTLMGCNPFQDLVGLAVTKWTDPEESEPNDAMLRGNVLEPALVAHAATLLGQDVTTPDSMWSEGRFIATLDGISADGTVIVEAKTTVAYSSDDPLPDTYMWQGVAQLCCHPTAERVLFIVLDKRMRLGTWELRRDPELCDRLMARADEIGAALDARQLPDEIELTETAVKMLYPEPAGEVEIGSAGLQAVRELQAAKEALARAEQAEKRARDTLAALLADADTGTVDGRTVVTFKARKGSMRLDAKALERDHGDLVAQYKVQGGSTRILRVLDTDA